MDVYYSILLWIVTLYPHSSSQSEEKCNSALGMKNRGIPDESITASSQLDSNHDAFFGRLHGSKAWCSAKDDEDPYIEIKLDEEHSITALSTQGSSTDGVWSSKYRIEYHTGGKWTQYQKELSGNRNLHAEQRNNLDPEILTKSIRIFPKDPFSMLIPDVKYQCLRVELYGCLPPADCRDPGRPINGRRTGDDFNHGNRVSFSCKQGFFLIGNSSSVCNMGKWNNTLPQCKATCEDPGIPENGNRKGIGNFIDGDTIEFSCNRNYSLFGSSISRCLNGRWSSTLPQCKAVCKDPGMPLNGKRIGNDFGEGQMVAFSCDTDFTLVGPSLIFCVTGQWHATTPICKAPCVKLSRPANAYMWGRGFRHGNQVRFLCYAGYQRIGAASSRCNDGTWSNGAPVCKGICGRPIVSSRGPLILHGNSFLDGDEVEFSCIANYDMFGSQRSRCVGQKWNTRIPECKGQCVLTGDSHRRFPSERRRLKHGSSLKFGCNESHVLLGSSIVHCIDGKWNATFPSCKAPCLRLQVDNNVKVNSNETKHGTSVSFSCDEVFQLEGLKEIMCLDGNWTGIAPSCRKKVFCPGPSPPARGKRLGNNFQDGRSVTFECDKGFDLFGSKTIKCIGGLWNASIPDCKACQNPIGMENPSTRNIRITSADYLSSPNFARLNGRFAWCTTKQTYLQVNLGKRHQLTAIATQGGQDNTGIINWVRKYKLGFFAGRRKEIFYQESGTQQVIDGNQNASSTITYFFKEPFVTQVVRIYPNFHSTPVCLRMELYGCDPNPDCIHVGSVVWGLWERKGVSLNYYLVYITQLNATHVDFVLDYYEDKFLTRSYNRSEPVLVVDKTPKMTDISVGSRVIGVHKRKYKEWYQAGTVTQISRSSYHVHVRFNSGIERWVPLGQLRLEQRPRFCTNGA